MTTLEFAAFAPVAGGVEASVTIRLVLEASRLCVFDLLLLLILVVAAAEVASAAAAACRP